MKLCQLFGVVVLIVVQIGHGDAIPADETANVAPAAADDGPSFIEILIQKLSMNNFTPVDINQIGQTLQYCQQRVDTITELIVKQYPASSPENMLALLSSIHDVFDAIGETASTLENSLNGIVGCVDLAVLDVQIALQVLVEAFISNCDVLTSETENRSDTEPISTAVYCLSSAVRTLLTSMSDLVEKVSISAEAIDANVLTGLQMIVQTIMGIVDRVLYCVKRMELVDLDGVEASLEKFSLIIQRLAEVRLNFVSKISPTIISTITEVLDSLKSNVEQLPQMTRKNIASLSAALTIVEDTVQEKNISATVASLLDALQPMFVQLSFAVHSIKGVTDAVAYSTDMSLQNIMASIRCATLYIALVTKSLAMIETSQIGTNLQSMLCFIASSIHTLVDVVTLAVERALVDLVCVSPTMDKAILQQQLLELQSMMEPIILTLEKVIGMSIDVVENILSLAARAMSDISTDLISDMNVLINNLQRIVMVTMESALLTKATPIDDNELLAEQTGTSTATNDLSICVTSFEAAAKNAITLRGYFNKSIDQIRRYLIQM